MSWGAHVWIGTVPLGSGVEVIPLCQRVKTLPAAIRNAEAVALQTSDLVVGEKFRLPEWCCRKCAAVAEELAKSDEKLYAYAVAERYEEGK